MLDDAAIRMFDAIYATDLVYAPGCWQLCGNAHCCTFERYKSRMVMLGRQHTQELPLLPGEYEYLRHKGWWSQFRQAEHRVVEYELSAGTMRIEFLVGRSGCACVHETRTTICRLYPLLPLFEVDGRLVGADPNFGMYEEIEAIDGLERQCRIDSMPLGEVRKFLAITTAIGRNPRAVFYASAYREAKEHARAQLRTAKAARPSAPALALFEGMFVLKRLLDQGVLRPRLDALAGQFRDHYGPAFTLG